MDLNTDLNQVDDPTAPNAVENAGAVAADSLAAESTRAGGAFSENRGSEPMGVKGSNSTFANTDTSGAETLEAAPNSQTRKANHEDPDASYPSALGGQDKSVAVTKETSASESASHAGVAPSYVNPVLHPQQGGPKGKNLTEGGFDVDDKKNASFISDIGDENDPGRLAEEKFAKINADQDASGGTRQSGGGDDSGQYDALEDTSA
jgi:hypothetical protein